MKVIVEYHQLPYGAPIFSFPEFRSKEVIEYTDFKKFVEYIESKGYKYKKSRSFGFDFISSDGGVKVIPYKPTKIKKI